MAKYGITLDDYERMSAEQAGECAICGRHESEFRRRLAVDHDHESGAVRGLLCSPCNTGIGSLGDSVSNLIRAARYLNSYHRRDPQEAQR